MPKSRTDFILRFSDPIMKEKLSVIAKTNYRSLNSEIEFLIDRYVKEYEKENGAINLESEDEK